MKTFEAKTEEEALELAAQDLKVEVSKLDYYVISDVKKLFGGHKITIGVFTLPDVIEYATNYLEVLCQMIEIKITTNAALVDDIIKIDIETDTPPRIIGHNGETLRALNELTRSGTFNKFGGHYRILLNCDNYKDEKYEKLLRTCRRLASEVKRTGVTAVLDPMTSDERRVIHNALSQDLAIKTVSEGVGRFRHLTIKKVNTPIVAIEPTLTPSSADLEEESPEDEAN